MVDRGSLYTNKGLSFIDSRALTHAPKDHRRELPKTNIPRENDVICSRGADSYNHIGNRRFRRIVDRSLAEYSKASTKFEKSIIVNAIVDEVRHTNGGMFVRQDSRTGCYFEVEEKLSREKVGQAIRAQLRKTNLSQFVSLESSFASIESSISSSTSSCSSVCSEVRKELRVTTVAAVEVRQRQEVVVDNTTGLWDLFTGSKTPPVSVLPSCFDPIDIFDDEDSTDNIPSPPLLRQSSAQWSEFSEACIKGRRQIPPSRDLPKDIELLLNWSFDGFDEAPSSSIETQ